MAAVFAACGGVGGGGAGQVAFGPHQGQPLLGAGRCGGLAVRAQAAYQPLGDHADQCRPQQVRCHAEVDEAGDGAHRIVGVQGREHQVPGQRGLGGDLGGFQVTNLADHDDVRVLAQQGAHAVGEPQPDGGHDLHLVEGRLDQFDGVLDGADIDLGPCAVLQGGVERRGLARTGGAGDQDDAVRLRRHRPPQCGLRIVETQ